MTLALTGLLSFGGEGRTSSNPVTAADILGNPDYIALSYGGYRQSSRNSPPSVTDIKEDLRIMSAMGVKLLRTYNTQQFSHAANLIQAIHELKNEVSDFEMFVMLGVWIQCQGAFGDSPDHTVGDDVNNHAEIAAAVQMVNDYPDIVKIIAVGNEAMVKWATSYYVEPSIILEQVNYLQALKADGEIPAETWITSSDNFASWGGGSSDYHTDKLVELVEAVDFISLHTYPFHDTHYNPSFWAVPADEETLSKTSQIEAAMKRARDYAISQYQGVGNYVASLNLSKPLHIGESGWSTTDNALYNESGSAAADEFKAKLYYDHMRAWTNENQISLFYFEAFDEKWKDSNNALGSENHFGLINLEGQAKYVLWEMVERGVFDGLSRGGVSITKTYNGDEAAMMADLHVPDTATK